MSVAVALIAGIQLVATAPKALAARSCQTSFGSNYFDGTFQNPYGYSNYNGVQSNIVVRLADLCTTSTSSLNTSAAWVMTANTNSLGGWIQSGYWNQWSGGIRQLFFFSQWKQCSTCTTYTKVFRSGVIIGTITNGKKYHFRVVRFGGDGRTRMEACVAGTTNCDVWDTTSFDYSNGYWSPRAEAFGETNDPGDDMPGRVGSKATFSILETERGSTWGSDTWTGAFITGSSRYHFDWVNTNAKFQIWTDPL